jgi:mRNA interferase MazF
VELHCRYGSSKLTPTSGEVRLEVGTGAVSARVTVAPITTTIRGLSTEVAVGRANGLVQPSVISCDDIVTVPKILLGKQIGYLLPAQEATLSAAIHAAFDLD